MMFVTFVNVLSREHSINIHVCECIGNTRRSDPRKMRTFEPSGCLFPNIRTLNQTPNDIPTKYIIAGDY